MSSKIEILKKCIYCQQEYIAKTLVTKYCSHRCNQRHYKEVKRQEKMQQYKIVVPIKEERNCSEDFLTITKSAAFLGVSDRTIFRLIARGIIKAVRKGKKVQIPKNELFKITVYDHLDS